MSSLPKLKIKLLFRYLDEDIFELEQAKNRLDFNTGVILVEGQEVHSYDELVNLASQEKYKDKEFLEVVLLPLFDGG